MRTTHLTEVELQQYALDKAGCDAAVMEHLAVCESCRTEAEAYVALCSAIAEAPRPSFDFDVAALVLEQLPQRRQRITLITMTVYVLAGAGLLLAGAGVWLFRAYVAALFAGASSIAVYLGAVIAAGVLVFQLTDLYRVYKKKMHIIAT